jgi:hypothetical protein
LPIPGPASGRHPCGTFGSLDHRPALDRGPWLFYWPGLQWPDLCSRLVRAWPPGTGSRSSSGIRLQTPAQVKFLARPGRTDPWYRFLPVMGGPAQGLMPGTASRSQNQNSFLVLVLCPAGLCSGVSPGFCSRGCCSWGPVGKKALGRRLFPRSSGRSWPGFFPGWPCSHNPVAPLFNPATTPGYFRTPWGPYCCRALLQPPGGAPGESPPPGITTRPRNNARGCFVGQGSNGRIQALGWSGPGPRSPVR